jgi:SAM-dependent methyltransferase
MAGFDSKTLDFYREEAPVYVASGKGGISRHLEGFLARLSPGCSILELGCGGGIDAEYMVACGFEVEPTDGCPELAAKAAERLGLPVRVMRFDQLDAIAAYDAVWASASLLHVPRNGLVDVLTRVCRALKPGGLHCASYKGGGREGRDGFGRYFNYLAADEARRYYQAAGFEIVDTYEGLGGGYGGVQGPWVAITARRPEA